MAKVIPLEMVTRHNLPVDRVLAGAEDAELSEVVILGYRADGTEYFASSIANGPEVVWLMERMKQQLLNVEVEG